MREDWLEQAWAGCSYCGGTGTDTARLPKQLGPARQPCRRRDEHQRTAAKMEEVWNAALDAVLTKRRSESTLHVSVENIEALRQRGPDDAD